jgi:hypothetical protein
MTIITHSPTQQLRNERTHVRYRSEPTTVDGVRYDYDIKLYWEMDNALLLVSLNDLGCAIWQAQHQPCHDHEMRHCPICHRERPDNPRWDIPQEAVQ